MVGYKTANKLLKGLNSNMNSTTIEKHLFKSTQAINMDPILSPLLPRFISRSYGNK
uniref:Uncharacterized protein n=1 Tax=Tetranychus urticae TaxID=32264 RepID=T1KLI5_TETUR